MRISTVPWLGRISSVLGRIPGGSGTFPADPGGFPSNLPLFLPVWCFLRQPRRSCYRRQPKRAHLQYVGTFQPLVLVDIPEHVYTRMLSSLYACEVDEPAQNSLDCCESVRRLVLILVIESLEVEVDVLGGWLEGRVLLEFQVTQLRLDPIRQRRDCAVIFLRELV